MFLKTILTSAKNILYLIDNSINFKIYYDENINYLLLECRDCCILCFLVIIY